MCVATGRGAAFAIAAVLLCLVTAPRMDASPVPSNSTNLRSLIEIDLSVDPKTGNFTVNSVDTVPLDEEGCIIYPEDECEEEEEPEECEEEPEECEEEETINPTGSTLSPSTDPVGSSTETTPLPSTEDGTTTT